MSRWTASARVSALKEAYALYQKGQLDEAATLYRNVLAHSPRDSDALYLLGVTEFRKKNSLDAIEWIDRAIEIRPNEPNFFYSRGNALGILKRFEEAVVSYDRALAISPNYAEVIYNRGNALGNLQRFEDAVASYDSALALKPDYADALHKRGNALAELNRIDEAILSYDRALKVRPDYAEALYSRGVALGSLKRYEDALADYDRLLALRPDHHEAFNSRGIVLAKLGRFEEALTSYDRALAIKPNYPDALYNRGITRLLVGRFQEGWADYEWRWKVAPFSTTRTKVDAPEWQGEDLAGRTMLVFTEQSAGEAILCVRYLPLLVERGAKVFLLAPPKLIGVLRTVSAQVQCISSPQDQQSFDFQCALMSLPMRFGTDLTSIPHPAPYLGVDEAIVRRWKQTIGDAGFKIGIAWEKDPQQGAESERGFPLSETLPFARLPGVRLIGLQKSEGLDQLTPLLAGLTIETLGDEVDSGTDAFVDTAAVVSNLDLIITADSSIAHLAGALGIPTWVALPPVPDWPWLLDREDSPWYPTLRLFRQNPDGDWKQVFSKMVQELQSRLASSDSKIESKKGGKALNGESRQLVEFTPKTDSADPVRLTDPPSQDANLRLKACRHGVIMFHANGGCVGRSLDLYGEFSEGELELLNCYLRPGMTVIDAGANIGAHTVCFARTVGSTGRVFAFEPHRILYEILCGNVSLNGHTNVVALNAGLGAGTGTIVVPRVDYALRGNLGAGPLEKWQTGEEEVSLRALHSCGLKACHLIKINVEDMVVPILEGAKPVLEAHKPVLYVGSDRTENSKAPIAWLLAHGYRLYWHLPRLFNAKNFFGQSKNIFGDTVSVNLLCIPRSMTASIRGLREVTSPEDQ